MPQKIKNSQVKETYEVIATLPPFRKAPKAVFAMAKNLRTLKAAYEDYTSARSKLAKECFGELEEVKKDHHKMGEFIAAHKVLLDTETEVSVHQFSEADLNLSENEISPAALNAIAWLITDF